MFQKVSLQVSWVVMRKKNKLIKDASLVLDLSYWVSDGITDYDCADKKKEDREEEKVCRANKVGGKGFIQVQFEMIHLSGND